jgi:hypothetical protein
LEQVVIHKTVTVELTVEHPESGDTDVCVEVALSIDPGVMYGPPENCVEPTCDAEVIDAYHFDAAGNRYPFVLSDKDADRACDLAMEVDLE